MFLKLCLRTSTLIAIMLQLCLVLLEDFLQLQTSFETVLLKKKTRSNLFPLFSYLRTILSSIMFVPCVCPPALTFSTFTRQITVNLKVFLRAHR